MRFTQSTQGIDAVNGGIGSIFKALAMAPMIRQQAEDQSALRDAQMYAANMSGNKYGSEAAGNQYTLDMRKGIPERIAADPNLTAGVRRAYEAFQLGGPQYVDQVMKGFGEGQTQDIRQLAVDNVGNADLMNRYSTLAQPGQTYEPFRADGGTGRAINQATGTGGVYDATLAKIYNDYKGAQTSKERAQAGLASERTAAIRQGGIEEGVDEEGNPIAYTYGTAGKVGVVPGITPRQKGSSSEAALAKARAQVTRDVFKDVMVMPEDKDAEIERRMLLIEGGQAKSPAGSTVAQTIRVSDKAAYDRLPSGTTFIAPDGTTRIKP